MHCSLQVSGFIIKKQGNDAGARLQQYLLDMYACVHKASDRS